MQILLLYFKFKINQLCHYHCVSRKTPTSSCKIDLDADLGILLKTQYSLRKDILSSEN